MTTRKRPEQRSTNAPRPPGQPAAKPTGDEVFSSAGEKAEAAEQPELTAEERAEFEELERVATEAYEQLGQVAERLSDRAADACRSGRSFVQQNPGATLLSSFALGVVLALLISKK